MLSNIPSYLELRKKPDVHHLTQINVEKRRKISWRLYRILNSETGQNILQLTWQCLIYVGVMEKCEFITFESVKSHSKYEVKETRRIYSWNHGWTGISAHGKTTLALIDKKVYVNLDTYIKNRVATTWKNLEKPGIFTTCLPALENTWNFEIHLKNLENIWNCELRLSRFFQVRFSLDNLCNINIWKKFSRLRRSVFTT